MKICIYTQESVEGKKAIPVKEDRIIRTIRSIKKAFNIAQMNELYVSEEHLAEHKKRRSSFERSMLFASIFAGLVLVLIIFSLILSGRFDIWVILASVIIAVFVLSLPLFKYSPALDGDAAKVIGSKPAPKPAKKRKKSTSKKR